jgi:SEL1 protein
MLRRGLPVDLAKATSLYRTAYDLGDAQAAFNLGYMYEHGEGLPKDLHLAKRYNTF